MFAKINKHTNVHIAIGWDYLSPKFVKILDDEQVEDLREVIEY
jgi:hypothetical protein